MKKVWKIQRENKTQFVVTTTLYEDVVNATSWTAFVKFLEDVANEQMTIAIHIFSPRPGQLTVQVENINVIFYYVSGDYDVQVFRAGKRYYLARGYELHAFETENELKAKLQELSLPFIFP